MPIRILNIGGEGCAQLQHELDVIEAVELLTTTCHTAAKTWWIDNAGNDIRANPLTFSNKLLLVVTEIAEACEGDRKNLMDDHLPDRPMREVELADAVIRIFDLAGGYNLDIAGAIVEKLAYNANRADHKPENRKADGGKTY